MKTKTKENLIYILKRPYIPSNKSKLQSNRGYHSLRVVNLFELLMLLLLFKVELISLFTMIMLLLLLLMMGCCFEFLG